MTRILMSGVAALAICAAALPAQAQDSTASTDNVCLQNADKLRTELRDNEAFAKAYRAGRVDARDYQSLRQAAITFARNGMAAKCEEVVSGMRALAERQSAGGDARDDNSNSTTGDRPDNEREARRMAALKSAQPLADASVSIETIMGKDVRNLKDEDLGDVEDVVMNNGSVEHVIVGRGGFLGMGVTYYQVAWKDLKVTQENETVVLDVTKEQIEAMPKVEKREGRWVAAAADDRDRPDRSGTPAPKTDDGAKQPMQPKTNPDQ